MFVLDVLHIMVHKLMNDMLNHQLLYDIAVLYQKFKLILWNAAYMCSMKMKVHAF